MARRLPSPPPALHGYSYVRPLGSGGFADVFCYEQAMPRRTVAVKVLLADVPDAEIQDMFRTETMVMAQLASHPSVLTVYEASISADGRPYLVTELCPTGYGDRFRTETISLAETLQVAIAVGSVLETAHRAGVMHRDIKPANILITQYGRPVLADFGIAATIVRTEGQEAIGMSIPWSSPEVISGTTSGDVRTEIWGFGATIYALLAGRSPFEVPGSDNSRDSVQRRILGRSAVRPTGRPDVPPSLEAILARTLDKDPAKRPGSVLEVLRQLQLVESELGLRPTPLDIPTETFIDASQLTATATESAPVSGRRRRRGSVRAQNTAEIANTHGGGTTVLRVWSDDNAPAERSSKRWLAWGAGGVVAIAAIVGLAISFASGSGGGIPQVTAITAQRTADSITFTWQDPGIKSTDQYLVRVNEAPGDAQQGTSYVVDTADLPGRVCVTVTVVRDGEQGPTSNSECTEA